MAINVSISWCYKTFFWGNVDFPKIKKLKKVCWDVWTCTKMWKHCAIFNQIYTLKLYIAFKMAYSCCFSLGGNIDFPEFLQKSFITSTTGETHLLYEGKLTSYFPGLDSTKQVNLLKISTGQCGLNQTSKKV